jgi:hypothetical protein
MSWSLSCFATTSIILKGWRYRYVCQFLSHITVPVNHLAALGRLVRAPVALVLMSRNCEAAGKMNQVTARSGCLFFQQRQTLPYLRRRAADSKVNRPNFWSPYDPL